MISDAAEVPTSTGSANDRVSVRSYRAADTARWDDFVTGCPTATFFHLSGWKRVIEAVFGHRTHYLYAERAGSIIGVLPLAEVRSRMFGHSLSSLPFCVYAGCASADPGAISLLHRRAEQIGSDLGVDHLELRHRERREPTWAHQDLYVTFQRELEPNVEANMLAIPRKQRAMVRKGIKSGLTSEVDESPERFFALYLDNVHRHGTPPLPRRYFVELKRVFGPLCEFLVVLDANGKPVSGVLSFYFRDQVLPYYAGDLVDARELAANDFKYWDLMRMACERGCRVFDYGRSKLGTGSFDFKKNWGFEPTPLHYEYRLIRGARVPDNNPLSPKYQLFIRAWRHLPRPLVTWLGPHIVRNLG